MTPSPEVQMPSMPPVREIRERPPVILFAALGLAVVLLGASLVRVALN